MDKDALSLVSTEDLWNEMCGRFDACLFIYQNNLDRKDEESQFWFKGGKYTCLGLVIAAKVSIEDSVRAGMKCDEVEDEE